MDAAERERVRQLLVDYFATYGLDLALRAIDALDAGEAKEARWLERAAREREEADNAREDVRELREILVALVADSGGYGGDPCHAESGACFWCDANQWVEEPHSADCPWRRALEVVGQVTHNESEEA